MPRKTDKELQKIMADEGCDRIWSWSKWDSFFNSPYEYYLKYIAKIPEDRTDCIYATTGTIAHDILEKFYSGELTYEEMIESFNDGWVAAYNIGDMKFDRNDEERNKKIGNKYYADLKHFFENHQKITYKPLLEQFAKIKVGDNLFQGYIDCCFKDENGIIYIWDWKTSSQYKGEKVKEKSGQLVLYALSLIQNGIPMDKIRIAWNFLKYVTVTTPLKNGTVKERVIERFELGDKLKSNVKTWLKDAKYSNEEIEDYLEQLVMTNDIKCLPKEIQEKYTFKDCVTFIPLTQDLIDYWVDLILKVINQIEYCEDEYKKSGSEKAFWDTDEQVEKQSYYFATLCGYSPQLHKPYGEYLSRLEAQKNGDTTFFGVGGDTGSDVTPLGNSNSNDDTDLSWLDKI